jgi:hypothetical protein
LRHLGLPSAPKRSALSYANSHRPCQLFEELFYRMLGLARSQAEQAGDRHKFRFKNKPLSIDATTIELCASIFDRGAVPSHQGSRQAAPDARSRRSAALPWGYHRRQTARSHCYPPVESQHITPPSTT